VSERGWCWSVRLEPVGKIRVTMSYVGGPELATEKGVKDALRKLRKQTRQALKHPKA